ncbi:LysE family transporter [Paenibacillus sp. 7124]|uniref:LysE family transporter n=1 Tax=Paenibacillus apii TaxID=1850370 RepID=A0A6M1PIP5_9BACL|nr:LysE family transporter [Paenibacillus apii]NJJ39379.1 LysE family transporter [Paenibacillus apii]
MVDVIIHGVILAVGLILPLGAQNIFVFNQGALQPRYIGALPVVVTAALCDTLLIFAAVGGVSLAVLSLHWLTPFIYGAGAVFLIMMGRKILRESHAGEQAAVLPVREQVGYALSVSLLNPHALMDTVGVIGTSSLQYGAADRWTFAAAAAGVSWLWFMGLSAGGRALGKADPSGRLVRLLNIFSALLLWGMAGYMVWQLWAALTV